MWNPQLQSANPVFHEDAEGGHPATPADDWATDSFELGKLDSVLGAERASPRPAVQLSIKELFFVVTLSAVFIGTYTNISALLALLGGGILLVVAVLWYADCQNLISGGLTGFLATGAMTFCIVNVGQVSENMAVVLLVMCPAVGYLAGFAYAGYQAGDL